MPISRLRIISAASAIAALGTIGLSTAAQAADVSSSNPSSSQTKPCVEGVHGKWSAGILDGVNLTGANGSSIEMRFVVDNGALKVDRAFGRDIKYPNIDLSPRYGAKLHAGGQGPDWRSTNPSGGFVNSVEMSNMVCSVETGKVVSAHVTAKGQDFYAFNGTVENTDGRSEQNIVAFDRVVRGHTLFESENIGSFSCPAGTYLKNVASGRAGVPAGVKVDEPGAISVDIGWADRRAGEQGRIIGWNKGSIKNWGASQPVKITATCTNNINQGYS